MVKQLFDTSVLDAVRPVLELRSCICRASESNG